MRRPISVDLISIFLSVFVSNACQDNSDCSLKKFCAYNGTCRCQDEYARSRDGPCVNVSLMNFVCRNGRCLLSDQLEEVDLKIRQTVFPPTTTTTTDDKNATTIPNEVHSTPVDMQFAWGMLLILSLFILQLLTRGKLWKIFTYPVLKVFSCLWLILKIFPCFSSIRFPCKRNERPSVVNTDGNFTSDHFETSRSVFPVDPEMSREFSDSWSLSSESSLDSLRMTVASGLEARGRRANNPSAPPLVPQNDQSVINIPSAPLLVPQNDQLFINIPSAPPTTPPLVPENDLSVIYVPSAPSLVARNDVPVIIQVPSGPPTRPQVQNDEVDISIFLMPSLITPHSSRDNAEPDDPPSYNSLQPLSCTLLDPPPYQYIQSPLSYIPKPPSYEEAIQQGDTQPTTSAPPIVNSIETPNGNGDTGVASNEGRF